jgi:hypothetical protein
MATSELKNNLIQLILDVDNVSLLEHLTDYFKAANEKQEWWDTISPTQQAFILRSSEQIKEGKVIPHAVVKERINQILAN